MKSPIDQNVDDPNPSPVAGGALKTLYADDNRCLAEITSIGILVEMDSRVSKSQNQADTKTGIYTFQVELKSSAGKSEEFDKMLSSYFGNGSPVSLFKPRGYEGASTSTPKVIAEKGGELFLSDPAVDGNFVWKISMNIDLKRRLLTLVAGEMHY